MKKLLIRFIEFILSELTGNSRCSIAMSHSEMNESPIMKVVNYEKYNPLSQKIEIVSEEVIITATQNYLYQSIFNTIMRDNLVDFKQDGLNISGHITLFLPKEKLRKIIK